MNELLRRWRLILGVPFAAALIAAIVVVVIPKRFTASASFAPDLSGAANVPSGLAGLAASFGIASGGQGPGGSYYYASLIVSRPVLERAVSFSYANPDNDALPDSAAVRRTLIDIYGIDEDLAPHDRMLAAVSKLTGSIDVSTDDRTGIVTVNVTAATPHLAASIARVLVSELQRLDVQTRQARARAEVEFIQERLRDVKQQLGVAESTLVQFYQRNRYLGDNPGLKFQEVQLRSAFDLQNSLFATLSQQLEAAQLSAVRDTPVLSLLVNPVPPADKSFPQRTLTVIVSFLLGFTFAIATAFLGFKRRQAGEEYPADAARLSDTWHSTLREIAVFARRILGRGKRARVS